MAAQYQLVLNSGPIPGKIYPLEKAEIFIGRDLGNDIVINDPEVSRRHARLYMQGNSYIIEDLGSTNGTAVNNQRLTGPYVLHIGEQITFGERINLVVEAGAKMPDSVPANEPAQTPPAYAAPAKPPVFIPPAPIGNQPAPYQPPAQPPQNYAQNQQGYPFQAPAPQQPAYSPTPEPPAYQPQPTYQAPVEPMQSSQFSGQVPTPQYTEESNIRYRIPIWIFVLIGVLLITILILLIDDFRLWCPLFGICT
ncbi:MAG TPA: FHA domain-containing protein [Anaerolineaceae bacterium]|nr:FHA domain-containing protein [Anaerolineaceae bacterium]